MRKTGRLQTTFERIYRSAAEELSELMDTRNMYIALYDSKTGMIEFPFWFERGRLIPQTEKVPGHQAASRLFGERKGLTDWIIENGKPLLIEKDFEKETSRRGIKAFAIGTKCWLGAPVILRGKVIGVIGLQNFDQEGKFDAGHRNLLMTIASQVAVAIENVRLLEDRERHAAETAAQEAQMRIARQYAEERQRRLTELQEISERIAEAGSDAKDILKLVVLTSSEITKGDLTSVYLYDDYTSSFTGGMRLRIGGNIEEVLANPVTDQQGSLTRIASTQEAIFVERVAEEDYKDFLRKHNVRAFAGLPLTVAGPQNIRVTVGVLFINFRRSHPFSDEEREILRHLANQAAVAIAYAEARSSSEANEQLAALGTAVAMLQHRLGNTLAITLPAIMRLRYRVPPDPITEDILQTIERNTGFASDVVRRMQIPLKQEPFVPTDINGLLREAILQCVEDRDRFAQTALSTDILPGPVDGADESSGTCSIMIKADLAPKLPQTFSRIGRLNEVFRVLIDNAMKAIYPNSGLVTVSSILREGGRRPVIEIVVSDDGKGIEDAIKKRLCAEPIPKKDFQKGAGLGLWLSGMIIRSHQGRIWLQWTEIGKGSIFYIHLPVLSSLPFDPERSEQDHELK